MRVRGIYEARARLANDHKYSAHTGDTHKEDIPDPGPRCILGARQTLNYFNAQNRILDLNNLCVGFSLHCLYPGGGDW